MRRSVLWGVLGVGAVVVVLIAYDALVVTDEERLEAFVDSVHGEVTSERIDEALSHCDPSIEPVEVQVFGDTTLYTDSSELESRARESLRRFSGDDLRVMTSSVRVEDGRGNIRLRLLSSRGMMRVDFTLVAHGERWLVSKVMVSR
jgi:hypothetical protein